MKTRIPVYTACILIIITVQSTLADYIMINNVKPNLLIIFIISVALLRGIFEGGIVGFIAGLVQDILFGKVMGFYTLPAATISPPGFTSPIITTLPSKSINWPERTVPLWNLVIPSLIPLK
jgi:hypothetical protein